MASAPAKKIPHVEEPNRLSVLSSVSATSRTMGSDR